MEEEAKERGKAEGLTKYTHHFSYSLAPTLHFPSYAYIES